MNTNLIRKDFPILQQTVNGKPLIYLDNAATTQKPQAVIDRITDYYKTLNSNVHRGVHTLSQEATAAMEHARETVQKFINAKEKHEIVFTKGTTESINLVAQTFAQKFLNEGDSILISAMEHHANIVPWQQVCKQKKANLSVIPILDNGELDLSKVDELLSKNVKLLAVTHISNVLGTINPIELLIEKARKKNIPVLIDAAQSVAHQVIDVQKLDCDFLVFSGHKLYAPMGSGVLFGKADWLNKLPPYQFGGEMISEVRFDDTAFNELPYKFEAGTPNVEGILGLETAILYLQKIGLKQIAEYENELLNYATQKLNEIGNIIFHGTSKHKSAVLSFNIQNVHNFDVGTILDQLGIAVRTGHHCAQPLMEILCVPGTVRASFAFYNTRDEIDIFIEGVKTAKKMLACY
ncbi:MAG: cysteine desulfurase [Bacteroidales bacterium]|jgi:cysteine desulfurase/selenocysteine lyase|nr:cysteine desulfurase [Bacteroidales bacterium]